MIFFNANQSMNPEIISSYKAFLIKRTGEKLFDTWLGSGSLIFGHDREKNNIISIDMLPNGLQISKEFLRLVSQLVDFEVGGLGFQTSGSAAITRAARLARAIRKRSKIAVVGKFWHGSENEFLFKNNKEQISLGVPAIHQEETVWFESIDCFLSDGEMEKYAAIIVEPFQGADPSVAMLQAITPQKRNLLRDAGVLLLCDEIISGFRERYGSCTSSRISEPDVVVFGKVLALGFPVGMVLVNEQIMKNCESYPFWGGTFSSSPTQLLRVFDSLCQLKELDYNILYNNHKALIYLMQEESAKYSYTLKTGCGFSRVVSDQKPINSREFLSNELGFSELRKRLEKIGIYLAANGLVFPSVYNVSDF